MKNKLRSYLSDFGLLFIAFLWGSAFVVLKNTINELPVYFTLFARFVMASSGLAVIAVKKYKHLDKKTVFGGFVMGVCLFTAYSLQTEGLLRTTASKNGFLTVVYVIIVPFLWWIFRKERPDKYNVIAAFMCLAGIGLLSLNGDLSINIGDGLTLVSGVMYSLHIVATATFTRKQCDPILLTLWQFITCTVLFGISSLIMDDRSKIALDGGIVLSLMYMGFACTLLALLLQTICQKYANPSSASILMSLECVFCTVLSIIFLDERLSPRMIVGCVLIFLSIITCETKWSFLNSKKVKKV